MLHTYHLVPTEFSDGSTCSDVRNLSFYSSSCANHCFLSLDVSEKRADSRTNNVRRFRLSNLEAKKCTHRHLKSQSELDDQYPTSNGVSVLMPTTHLWAVSSCGKVFLLPSNGQQWEELRYYGVDFKRVSAVERCAWAIGGDHQVYVYVTASEVPIGFKEVSYENQRWNPKEGFSSRLLPTDRPLWSSQDGLEARPKDKIKPPTISWVWQADWAIEDNLDGQPLGSEGWMYALDFPTTYGPDKKFTSLVRRRKWVRYRHYIAMDKWTWVPSIHDDDPVREPFIDVAVGGLEMPGGDGDTLAVWAVTVQSRVMFRHNVMYNNPEGDGWMHISTPKGLEINQVSVGPTGLVWAVVWDGRALVRAGVTRFKITGTSWLEVNFPHVDSRLLNVAVGTNVVWAVSRDGKVWFRKGIRGMDAGTCDESACGIGWVEMVGIMSHVTVGPNDQVWAVSKDDQNVIHFRTDVTPRDLSGKRWRAITLPLCRRVSPTASESSLSLQLTQSATLSVKEHSKEDTNVPSEHGGCEGDSGIDTCSTGPSHDDVFPSGNEGKRGPSGDTTSAISVKGEGTVPNDGSGMPQKALPNYLTSSESSPRLSRSSISSSQGSVSVMEDELFQTIDSDFIWCWVSGGGCCIDSVQPLSWFSSGVSNMCSHRKELWRKELMHKLGGRYEKEVQKFANYEYAIEKKSWTKSGKCQVWTELKQWVDCQLELEQMASDNTLDSGTLTCMYTQNGLKKVHSSLIDVTCVLPATNQSKQVVDIYTAERTVSNLPIRLTFSSDTDMEDWIAVISTTCNDVRCTRGTPVDNAIWATSTRGDVFAHNPEDDLDYVPANHAFWRQIGGHLRVVETCKAGIVWGLGYNNVVWVYTGGWGGGLFQGLASSPTGIHSMTDVRHMYIYENQRWNPLTGFSSRGLPTDRYMWSDRSGRLECTKENVRLPSLHWQWITDWAIDYNTPSGVDKEGWQYAKDFPRTYHAHKGFADYVRRRRWQRKCKLITSGPWQELETVRLQDISFQVDCHSDTFQKPVSLWAVDNLGNVLYRHGVTTTCLQGTSWEHVSADQKFVAISVGGNGRVWGVARNGSAFMRNGVSAEHQTGMHWFHVEPPNKDSPLQQVSAGATAIWAVDKNFGLWVRQEVMPMFPEGTCWKYVCPNIRKISVGPNDQVWAVSESVDTPSGSAAGLICRRLGATNEEKLGHSWEYATGGGWCHVSARGYVSSQNS